MIASRVSAGESSPRARLSPGDRHSPPTRTSATTMTAIAIPDPRRLRVPLVDRQQERQRAATRRRREPVQLEPRQQRRPPAR